MMISYYHIFNEIKKTFVWAYFDLGIFSITFVLQKSLLKINSVIFWFYAAQLQTGMSSLSRFPSVLADIIILILKFAGAEEASGEYITTCSGMKSTPFRSPQRPSHRRIWMEISEVQVTLFFYRYVLIVEYVSGISVLCPCEISHTQICGR